MLQQFITDNQDADVAQLALQRNRYPMFSDSDFRFLLQQIDGRQRTRDKLPTFAAIAGWLYPPRLNLEQCSSERTARFKATLLSKLATLNSQLSTTLNTKHSTLNLIDATGGYGVDTFFMSDVAAETHYFEQNADLAAIAEHNFALAGKSIHCHAEPFDVAFLKNFNGPFTKKGASNLEPMSGVLYLDPARRDCHGGKVFRLEDCTPNVIDIVRYMQQNYPYLRILLKLSPMLDFHQAVRQLGGTWEVYVVSVNGEVKELLLLSGGTEKINAVMIDGDCQRIVSFTPDEESMVDVQYLPTEMPLTNIFVYEPDAALLKAGAFRLLSTRYGLLKAAPNTHLYFLSSQNDSAKQDINHQLSIVNGLGRLWQVLGVYSHAKDIQRAFAFAHITHANILTRNYVQSTDALRKQLRLKDGGDDYIIGCRIGASGDGKPVLLHCRRWQAALSS